MLYLILLCAFLAFVAAWLTYSSVFGWTLSHKRGDWAEFGEYLGGLLGPIFGLLTLFFLVSAFRAQVSANEIASRNLEEVIRDRQRREREGRITELLTAKEKAIREMRYPKTGYLDLAEASVGHAALTELAQDLHAAFAHADLSARSVSSNGRYYHPWWLGEGFTGERVQRLFPATNPYSEIVRLLLQELNAIAETERSSTLLVVVAQFSKDEVTLLFFTCWTLPGVWEEIRTQIAKLHLFRWMPQAAALLMESPGSKSLYEAF